MNKRHIEAMIPIAMDILKENSLIILTKDGKLPSNYSGYIDSYGPTIRQSGLLQAVTFNEKEKRNVINSLLKLLLEKSGHIENNGKSLTDIVKSVSNSSHKKAWLQKLILEAIVTCKHAMRTFPKERVKED